jgi:D-aminopeptidase
VDVLISVDMEGVAGDGGATSVVVNDSHGPMDNLLGEQLDPRAEYLVGEPKPLDMLQEVTSWPRPRASPSGW